ncbi:MAG: LAGLIDADG family homing endonuclease [Nanoarchaeota archaeon]
MKIKNYINKDFALIYGILAGDGCISKSGKYRGIVVTCNIHDDEPFFKQIVVPKMAKIRNKKVKYRKRPDFGKIEINFSDKELFNKFVSLEFPIGKKKNIKISKHFPKKVWNHIISGFFATDGSLVLTNNNGTLYPRIEIQNNSKIILEQIKKFLISKGMTVNVYRTIKINSFSEKKEKYVNYRLQSNGYNNLIKFRDVIGFINPKHEEKFKST